MRWTGLSAGKILSAIAILPAKSTDAAERTKIMKLLADEEAKFKLELNGRSDAPKDMISRRRSNRELSR